MKQTRLLAAVTMLATASLLAVVTAVPAYAAEHDVETEGWIWEEVDDQTGSIDDADSWFPNYLGIGLDAEGWTDDPFDGVPDVEDGNAYFPRFYGGDEAWSSWSLLSGPVISGGQWSIVVGGTTGDVDGNGNELALEVTLTIEGSFARWDFDFTVTGPDANRWTLLFNGNLGSDGDSVYIPVAFDRVVSHDQGFGPDPIIGWRFIGDTGFSALADDDWVRVSIVPASGDAAVIVGLLEYDLCSHSEALSAMLGYITQFETLEGSALPPIHGDGCVVYDNTFTVPAGDTVSVDKVIDSVIELDDFWGDPYFEPTTFGHPGSLYSYYSSAHIAQGPAGLNVALVWDPIASAATLQFTGTVSDAAWQAFGSGPIQVVLLQSSEYSELGVVLDSLRELPIVLEFSVERLLAATGAADASGGAVGAAALALAGAALFVSARRRARA